MSQAAVNRSDFYSEYGKRIFDISLGIAGLSLMLPLFVLIGAMIKLADMGPVFYKQYRIGQNFRPFYLIKFRSMVLNADKLGLLVTAKGDPRITSMGRLLRKTKLDELPQLFNVIKGDMSFVGPRPEVEKYVLLFRDDYKDILRIKPGITDYAAVEFREEEDILKKYDDPEDGYVKEVLPAKIRLYRKYLRDRCLSTDLKLIALTLREIVK